jgi:hypothetical protein
MLRYAARAAQAAQGTQGAGRLMGKVFIGIIVLAVLGVAGFSWLTLHWSYSEGERAGYVQKFAKKGWLCKTWEGEMAMVTMPGTLAEKFAFTVPSDAVAAKLNADIGKRVALHYEQHRWIPSSCFGDTEYFVTDVRVAE